MALTSRRWSQPNSSSCPKDGLLGKRRPRILRLTRSGRRSGGSDPPLPALNPELGLEQLVHRLRIGLAARDFHHLSDKPADRLRIGLGVGDLLGIFRDDLVD